MCSTSLRLPISKGWVGKGREHTKYPLSPLQPPLPHLLPFRSKYDPTSKDAMTFKHYNAKQVVMGRVSALYPSSSST